MLGNCVDLSTFAFLSFSVNEFKNSMVTTKKTDEHFVLTLITESNGKKNDNNHSDVSVPHSLAINSTFQLYEE